MSALPLASRLPLLGEGSLSPRRGALLVVLVAAAAYANSLGNGFAFDDGMIVEQNPVVVEGRPLDALKTPYWPRHAEGAGLYRPVTVAALSVEWMMGGGDPLVFHLANVAGHAAASGLVFLLLVWGLGVGAASATLGAALFAVHPVHVEAVANVVGQAEILAALFFLSGCLLYLWRSREDGWARPIRLVGIGAAYALSLGSKEMGATLPGVLLALELLARRDRSFLQGLRRELPAYGLLAGVLLAYAGLRYSVLGSLAGEVTAPTLRGLGTGERFLTALSLWPEYVRLLVFPLDLSADYGPAVLLPARAVEGDVILGGVIVAGLAGLAGALRRVRPLASLAVAWFAVTILPVSQLLFPAGVLLAERTLYLPSVAAALMAAAALEAVRASAADRGADGGEAGAAARRAWVGAVGVAVVVGVLFLGRTVVRNPVWDSTASVMRTLARDHPESFRSARSSGKNLERMGRTAEAADYFDLSVRLNPNHYGVLVEAAAVHGKLERWDRARELLERAVEVAPRREPAYRMMARHALLRGRAEDAHRAATTGLLRDGSTAALWSLLSESYVLRDDLPAAIRSREAALALAPDSAANWRRMAELRGAAGDSAGARAARRRAGDEGESEHGSRDR